MRKLLHIALFIGAVLLASGCVSVGENNNQNLPWSQPAGWEDQMLGIPY